MSPIAPRREARILTNATGHARVAEQAEHDDRLLVAVLRVDRRLAGAKFAVHRGPCSYPPMFFGG